jgi:hypothetical protein
LQPLELKSIFNMKPPVDGSALSVKGLAPQGTSNNAALDAGQSSQEFIALLQEMVTGGKQQPSTALTSNVTSQEQQIDPGLLAEIKTALATDSNVPVETIDDAKVISLLKESLQGDQSNNQSQNFAAHKAGNQLLQNGQVPTQHQNIDQNIDNTSLRVRSLQLPGNGATSQEMTPKQAATRLFAKTDAEYQRVVSLNSGDDLGLAGISKKELLNQSGDSRRVDLGQANNNSVAKNSRLSNNDLASIGIKQQGPSTIAKPRVEQVLAQKQSGPTAIRVARMESQPQTVEQAILEQRIATSNLEQQLQPQKSAARMHSMNMYGKGQQVADSGLIGRGGKLAPSQTTTNVNQMNLPKLQNLAQKSVSQPANLSTGKTAVVGRDAALGKVDIAQLYDSQHDQNLIRQTEFHRIADIDSSSSIGTGKVMNLDSGRMNSSTELVGKITDYLIQQGAGSGKEINVTVTDEQLGTLQLKVAKATAQDGQLDVKIVTDNQQAQEFFTKHQGTMVEKLSEANIKVSELQVSVNKLGLAGETIAKESSSSKNSDNNSNSQERSSSQGRGDSHSGRHAKDQDSQRRQELWEEFARRSAA